jgi:flagellar protein FliS
MSYNKYTSKYLENEVVSRPKEWLIPLLYEHLLTHLRRAQVQIRDRDLEGKGVSLEKASAIVIELLATLDHEKGGELAQRLAALYAYFSREIMNASRTLDPSSLEKIIEMVATLHESWVVAARAQAPIAPAGDTLYELRQF